MIKRLPLLLAIFLTGCLPQTIDDEPTQSYRVGQTLRANVGGTFFTAQEGSVKHIKHWVGILNAPDGWRTDTIYDKDYLQKELLYSGMSGHTIKITYREFRGGLAAQPFYQVVEYDLDQSNVITFQNFGFRVMDANNRGIEAELLHD